MHLLEVFINFNNFEDFNNKNQPFGRSLPLEDLLILIILKILITKINHFEDLYFLEDFDNFEDFNNRFVTLIFKISTN